MIELAGLLAATALLITLIAIEVRHAGRDTGQTPRPGLRGRAVSRGVVAVMWAMYLLLFFPLVLGLLV